MRSRLLEKRLFCGWEESLLRLGRAPFAVGKSPFCDWEEPLLNCKRAFSRPQLRLTPTAKEDFFPIWESMDFLSLISFKLLREYHCRYYEDFFPATTRMQLSLLRGCIFEQIVVLF